MGFVFVREAAVDEELGLKLELDLEFRDTLIPTLKLTDLASGHKWLVPTPTISEAITYEAREGPHTSKLDVGVRLRRPLIEPVVADMAARQRNRGRAMSDVEAKDIFEGALTTFFMRGGEMKKWIPGFRIEWV